MNISLFGNESANLGPRAVDIYSQVNSNFYLCLLVVELLVATATVLGNSMLLATVHLDPFRCLRTPTVYLMANLGVADFLVGAIVGYGGSVEMYFTYVGRKEPPFLNTIQYFVGAVALFVAVCSIIAMSWDRFIATKDPTNYKTRVTVKRAKLAILAIWMNAFLLGALPAAGVQKLNFLLAYCYSHFVFPALILTVVYFVVFRSLSENFRRLAQVTEASAVSSRRRLESERRILHAIFLVLIVFYACFTPYYVKVHLWCFCPGCVTSPSFIIYHFISNDILRLSSMLNPLIYAWRMQRIRKTLLKLLSRNSNRVSHFPVRAKNC